MLHTRWSSEAGSVVRVELLHPARIPIHEDPEPELEVDEGPQGCGRQGTVAQPVGIEDAPVETPRRSEDLADGLRHFTGEPSLHRNRERPLVPALDDGGRKQGPHDLLQKALRLPPADLYFRRDSGN